MKKCMHYSKQTCAENQMMQNHCYGPKTFSPTVKASRNKIQVYKSFLRHGRDVLEFSTSPCPV